MSQRRMSAAKRTETYISLPCRPRFSCAARSRNPCRSRFVQFVPQRPSVRFIQRLLACVVLSSICGCVSAIAQIPVMNVGPDVFGQIDFTQMYLDQVNRHLRQTEKQKAQDKELVDSGVVSALDLDAPNK